MNEIIMNYVRAGYAGLLVVSHEEARVESELKAVAGHLKYRLFAWSVTMGLMDTEDGRSLGAQDPMEAVQAIAGLPDNCIVLLRDFHMFLGGDPSPVLCRALKDELASAKTRGKVLVIVGCRQTLPQELAREITVIEFKLPDKAQVGMVLDCIAKSARLEKPEADGRNLILDAATGLTTTEAENAFALSVVECGRIEPGVVSREKARIVKKNGLLEIVEVRETLGDIGGLDLLKTWLLQRKDAFGAKAMEYRLPCPKGLLIIGIPGTGKSLTAKVTAGIFGRPLLKLDAGRLYGGLVGESEANIRSVIQTMEAIAPCVCWIDEIDKGFSGARSSGATDGGTSGRVFGTFISWMQEKTAPVFIVATANDVTQLPPEMLRKGRFDELFFVDLPNTEEREAIWRIQIGKYGRTPDTFDISRLAEMSEGWTGAEIEQTFIDALYAAFATDKEPTELTISLAAERMVPLSKLMGDQIAGLRKWAKGRTRMATTERAEKPERRIMVP